MDLLNLDELVSVKRTVVLGGKEYAIVQQSLGQMITAMKSRKSLDDSDQAGLLESMLHSAQDLMPDCPEEVLRRLNIKQMTALMEFASASDEALADETEDDAGN